MNLRIWIREGKPKKEYNVLSVEGIIQIGQFWEYIYVPLDLWSMHDYEYQWKVGLERLKTHDQSCLVATIHDPLIRRFIDWWLLYKIDNKVYVRNHMLVAEIYEDQIGNKPFTLDTCYDFIPARRIVEEDSDDPKPSECVVAYQ